MSNGMTNASQKSTEYEAGTGIGISDGKISNTGVTSVNGSTGAVTGLATTSQVNAKQNTLSSSQLNACNSGITSTLVGYIPQGGTSGQVWTSDGSGGGYWATPQSNSGGWKVYTGTLKDLMSFSKKPPVTVTQDFMIEYINYPRSTNSFEPDLYSASVFVHKGVYLSSNSNDDSVGLGFVALISSAYCFIGIDYSSSNEPLVKYYTGNITYSDITNNRLTSDSFSRSSVSASYCYYRIWVRA